MSPGSVKPGQALAVQGVRGRIEEQLDRLVPELRVFVAIQERDGDETGDQQTTVGLRVPAIGLVARRPARWRPLRGWTHRSRKSRAGPRSRRSRKPRFPTKADWMALRTSRSLMGIVVSNQ